MQVRIAVSGFGNVGQGMATLVRDHAADYRRLYGLDLSLVGVADRGGAVASAGGLDPGALLRAKATHGTVAASTGGVTELAGERFLDLAAADVLVEAASTNYVDGEPGWGYVRAAMDRAMHAVLASKGALALYWRELMARAAKCGVEVRYGATIGAPLPSLEIARRGLVGVDILGFDGILNATSHQVLSTMAEGKSYDEGIREAQAIGIAEADPTLDVDGWDAAAKATIVANAVLGSQLTIHDVRREGIRGVTTAEIREAQTSGQTIKLVASARRVADAVQAEVRPERRGMRDALGRLRGDDMGIVFLTEPLGRVSTAVESAGAGGGISTALAVLRDIVNLGRDGYLGPRDQE
ncbi:MAG TPA: homoserine dehydrogenase [Chloroflexota bacterium]|nr:homoserine dehydrogenase [Chloroflexota bacterium]